MVARPPIGLFSIHTGTSHATQDLRQDSSAFLRRPVTNLEAGPAFARSRVPCMDIEKHVPSKDAGDEAA